MKTFQLRLKNKLEEVYFLEPNNLGNAYLTSAYKMTTSFLKQMPFIIVIPMSIIFTIMLYVLVGPLVVKLTTLLQYGF
jgi:hypothetical protein